MGLLDRFRIRQFVPSREVDEEREEELEPLPPLSWGELWPPTPRVKILYIGIGFFLFNLLLLCIFVVVVTTHSG